MYAGNGIGLAAVQLGVLKRVFVMDVPNFGKYELINPVILDRSLDTDCHEEGCLSIPGIAAEVTRPKEVTVEYINLEGKKKKLKAKGLLAVCIQHEFDHLEGILFVDRLKSEERLEKLKEYRKLQIY
jgi:peptide deformylase